MFKLLLLSLGIIIGATWPAVFHAWRPALLILFLLGGLANTADGIGELAIERVEGARLGGKHQRVEIGKHIIDRADRATDLACERTRAQRLIALGRDRALDRAQKRGAELIVALGRRVGCRFFLFPLCFHRINQSVNGV